MTYDLGHKCRCGKMVGDNSTTMLCDICRKREHMRIYREKLKASGSLPPDEPVAQVPAADRKGSFCRDYASFRKRKR